MSLYTLCPPPPHPLPETFLLFMIGPDDMFLEIFFFFFWTLHLSTLTQASSQALPSFYNLLGFIYLCEAICNTVQMVFTFMHLCATGRQGQSLA